MPQKLLTLLLPTLFMMWLPGPALAQWPDSSEAAVIDWQELKTEKFLLVYANSVSGVADADCSCGIEEAQRYADFVDPLYVELVAVFGVELKTPINLRLFPTEATYYEVNPLARQLTGVIAHALNTRDEIAVALPRTKTLTDDEIVNNIRHELTHFFASFLSDGKLKAGFQEGIAQYLERPTDRASYDPAILKLAFQENRLLTWAELDEAQSVYSDPQVAYPQSLSIVSFLMDRYGLPTFMEFLKASGSEPGYRSALESAYGKSADELETEWLAYLPDYFDGRWQINAIYAYDLGRVTELVNKAAYTDAAAELTEIVTMLESTHQEKTLVEAEALLARAHQGVAAGALADEARQALQAGNYALAGEKGNAAIAAYETLGYLERIPEIQIYVHRAGLGQDALDQLSRGERLLSSFSFLEAEAQLREATVMLQSLGNRAGAEQGQTLLLKSAWQQSMLAYGVLAIGVILLIFNGLRRFIHQVSADPIELEFTS